MRIPGPGHTRAPVLTRSREGREGGHPRLRGPNPPWLVARAAWPCAPPSTPRARRMTERPSLRVSAFSMALCGPRGFACGGFRGTAGSDPVAGPEKSSRRGGPAPAGQGWRFVSDGDLV